MNAIKVYCYDCFIVYQVSVFVYWVILTRSLQTEFEIMLQSMLKHKIASFIDTYV
jgi:hypothetical protein